MNTKEFLRKLRIERGWNQQELADRLGIARTSVSMYEKGSREISIQTLQKMSTVFRIAPYYFLLPPCDNQFLFRYRYLLEYRRLCLQQICMSAGLKEEKMQEIEAGKCTPTQKEMEKLAKAFQVPTGLLADGFATDIDGKIYTMMHVEGENMCQSDLDKLVCENEIELFMQYTKHEDSIVFEYTTGAIPPPENKISVRSALTASEKEVLEEALAKTEFKNILVNVARGLIKEK